MPCSHHRWTSPQIAWQGAAPGQVCWFAALRFTGEATPCFEPDHPTDYHYPVVKSSYMAKG